jgi:DNA-binding IclR family transcriptional regulator
MDDGAPTKLLGSRRRTEVLVLTALLGDTYPTEIARLLGAPLYSIQSILNGLDREGIVAVRRMGNQLRISLDPRFFAFKELRALLLRLAEAEPELRKIAAGRRSRPRRSGQPL